MSAVQTMIDSCLAYVAGATRVVEVIAPAVVRIERRLVAHQPIQTAPSPCPGSPACRCARSTGEISPRHVAAALGRIERLDAEQRSQVDRTLAADLLQQLLQEAVAEGERPHGRRQSVEGLVALVVVRLDPALQPGDALAECARRAGLASRGSRVPAARIDPPPVSAAPAVRRGESDQLGRHRARCAPDASRRHSRPAAGARRSRTARDRDW